MNRNDASFIAQKIRAQYMEKDAAQGELEKLRELDVKAKRPARIFGWVFGSIGAIVMGAGMSLIMTDIGATIGISEPMTAGIAVGIIGMLMAIANYPIYKAILSSGMKKYSGSILALSEKLVREER